MYHTTKSTLQILEGARDLLIKGWTKNQTWDGGSKYCMEGALSMAAYGTPSTIAFGIGHDPEFTRACQRVMTEIQKTPTGIVYSRIANWNDNYVTSHGHVIFVMTRAIEVLKGEMADIEALLTEANKITETAPELVAA